MMKRILFVPVILLSLTACTGWDTNATCNQARYKVENASDPYKAARIILDDPQCFSTDDAMLANDIAG